MGTRGSALRLAGVALAAGLLVTACGGGDGAPSGRDGSGPGPDGGALPVADASGGPPTGGVPRAVREARAVAIPACTVFVDAANGGAADGSAARPHTTIAAAIAAAEDGAVICVAEGTYAEALTAGQKPFTLAGGFQSGRDFAVRDSARFVSRAQGDGSNVFLLVSDPGPPEGTLTAVDGFEITGYSQGIVRDVWYPQRFDLTNNHIHDNRCAQPGLAGGGFFLGNVSGTIDANVIARNTCGRGGGGALNDSTNTSVVTVTGNRVDANVGDEPEISHGGGLYLFANDLTLTANEFTDNAATGWGGGLYVGAYTGGGQHTTAALAWNVYRGNRAGGAGGGFFCDDSATCRAAHEIYAENCGGNVYLDSGPDDADPTTATFDHVTSWRGLTGDCAAPGAGVQITKGNSAADAYAFTNSILWGSAEGRDFEASCDRGCDRVTAAVAWSLVGTAASNGGVAVTFGDGMLTGVDPLFVDAAGHDFHLRSTRGHWTPTGPVADGEDSPALAAADPAAPASGNPDRAGGRAELGAYGDSAEASFVR